MIRAIVNDNTSFQLEFDKNHAKGKINGKPFLVDVKPLNASSLHILKDNKSYNVEVLEINKEEKRAVLLINGRKYKTQLKDNFDLLLESMGIGTGVDKQTKEVKAPMPGLVLEILVVEGDNVIKGDPLVILEAMKMENVLKSPADGTVKKINISKGIAVEKNQVLVSFN